MGDRYVAGGGDTELDAAPLPVRHCVHHLQHGAPHSFSGLNNMAWYGMVC